MQEPAIVAEKILFPSAARTATPTPGSSTGNPEEFSSNRQRTVMVTITVTAIAATPSVTFALEFWNPGSQTWVNSGLTSAAVVATGTTFLKAGPTIVAAANVAINTVLPGRCRVTPTHGNADSITYSVVATVTS